MSVRFRPFAGERDYMALRSLIVQNYADPKRRFYPSLGDLDYIRAFEEGDRPFRQKVTICELEDGTVIGAIWPGFFRILYCVTGSPYAYWEDEILSWAERRYCGAALKDRSGEEVYVWAYEEDEQRSRLLHARGYSMHTWYMYSGVIDLDAPLPAPRFPQGFKVRPIAAEDIEQKVAIMGASTGHGVPRLEKYFRLMESPTYRQQLDLVVVDSNNQVAAFANVWHDVSNQMAVIEPFGTKESYRRQGLATNLLYEIMHRLKALGVAKLYINHGGLWTLDPEPDEALRVYQQAGFKEWGKMFVWCKPCSKQPER